MSLHRPPSHCLDMKSYRSGIFFRAAFVFSGVVACSLRAFAADDAPAEWIEPATPVVPQKTVLITEKERAKRVKEGRKSYADPLFCGASGGSGEMRVAFPWTSKNVKLFNRI